jgi:hypothetical protein
MDKFPYNILRYDGVLERICDDRERFILYDIEKGYSYSYDDAVDAAEIRVGNVHECMIANSMTMTKQFYEDMRQRVVQELIGRPLPTDEERFDIYLN